MTGNSKCQKLYLVRHSHPVDNNLAKIRKTDKKIGKKPDFKDIKFPVKVRDIHERDIKKYIGINVYGFENKQKFPI